ncbi:hypothetical protein XM38_012740 [Halomicronema hongdechloris C2206]|uniref:DUF2281 domain-containing protein n=1 Tax=Halomicronema hongdechloris C2206 TaxID=1641165 RepID=A0A1Z3HJ92_9CYAN|nr:hypothetical protein [Halomicronema hongdechloris]ASC70336.1 hypothetical protein XM38_012740 [Halomicronema hongdechloris C2206]
MLRETLKQEIDQLSESQLRKIADFVTVIKRQAHKLAGNIPFWQRATPAERAEDFRSWIAQLPETRLSLPDEAFDRSNIYE